MDKQREDKMKPSAILCAFVVAFVAFVLTMDRASAAVNNTGTRSNTAHIGAVAGKVQTKTIKHPHKAGKKDSPRPQDRTF
jgi:hypothetical protein